MKITDIRVLSTRLPASAAAMVQVDTDEGIVGIGATSAPALAIAALVQYGPESMRAVLSGTDPTNTNDAWRKMFVLMYYDVVMEIRDSCITVLE